MASWWEPEKDGVDQVARVRVARVDLHLVAVLARTTDLVDVGEVDLRVDALGEQVHAQGDQVDVAGALALPEQAALDAVGAGHQRQLGGGDGGAAVVVRVDGDARRARGGTGCGSSTRSGPRAWTGVERSTVAGRLRMISRPGPGWQTSITASQTSSAKSSSVSVKISGLYW